MELVEFSADALASVSARVAFERVVPRDDSTLFRGFLVLPAVTRISDETGPWTRPGERRLVHLSDGGRFQEELLRYEPPATPDAVGVFDYRVTGFTKLLAHLVSDAEAHWRYEPAGNGSRIRWSYGFRPLRGRRFVVRALIGPIWLMYMRRSLAECVRVAEGA
ncbi:SRPBCC family protein [Herbiconiux sp. 11R-BC]|uniref:SRPBCC family protein n=1 Tax=Herbiconiux sp. 11R-BC TaxID=3111637 RepID=UPI003C066C73